MSETDPHAPTSAGPEPEATWRQQPVSDGPYEDLAAPQKPEVLIGGAFAGGFLAAMILKRLGR